MRADQFEIVRTQGRQKSVRRTRDHVQGPSPVFWIRSLHVPLAARRHASSQCTTTIICVSDGSGARINWENFPVAILGEPGSRGSAIVQATALSGFVNHQQMLPSVECRPTIHPNGQTESGVYRRSKRRWMVRVAPARVPILTF